VSSSHCYRSRCPDVFQPQNILLTDALPDGDIKLCDFGLARPFNSGDDVVEIVGTLDYVGKSCQNCIYTSCWLTFNQIMVACDFFLWIYLLHAVNCGKFCFWHCL